MPGWIKYESGLDRKSKTLSVAAILDLDNPAFASGLCMAFWDWLDHQVTEDNRVSTDEDNEHFNDAAIDFHTAPAPLIDRDAVRRPGFAAALCRVGWLVIDGTRIIVPGFFLRNGSTAKQRAVDAARQARNRGKPPIQVFDDTCHDDTVTHRGPSKEQQRAEKTKRKTLQQCSTTEPPSDPEASVQPVAAPIAALSSRGDVCSLLLSLRDWANLPLFDPGAAAAIASHPRATVEQVTWAVGRFKQKIKTESGRKFKSSPAAWLRGMIERNEPPDGWAEEFRRKQIRQIAAKGAA